MSKVTLTATINRKSGTVHASPSALRKAGLQPASKDKGVSASYTGKDGKKVEYKVYSVLDATPLEKVVKTSKVAKTATEKKFAAIDEAIAQQNEALQAILAKLSA